MSSFYQKFLVFIFQTIKNHSHALKTIVLVLLLTTFGTDVKRFKTNFNHVLLNNIQTQNYQAALQKVILLKLIEWKSF